MKLFQQYANENRWCGADEKKRPRNPKTGGLAKPNDPSTFGTLEEAEKLVETNNAVKAIGFRTGDGIIAFDLDSVIGIDGVIEPAAYEIMSAIDSYNEITLSHLGIKILARYEGEQTNGWSISPEGEHCEVGMLNWNRYTILTGNEISPEGLSGEDFDLLGRPRELALIDDDTIRIVKEIAKRRAGRTDTALSKVDSHHDQSGSGYAFRFARACRKEGLTQAQFAERIEADDGPAGEWWRRADDRQRERVWLNCDNAFIQAIEEMNSEFAHVMIGNRSRIAWFCGEV